MPHTGEFPLHSDGLDSLDQGNETTREFLLRRRHSIARINGQSFDVQHETDLLEAGAWLTPREPSERAPRALLQEPAQELFGLSQEGMERTLASARIIAITEGLQAVELERVIRLAGLNQDDASSLRAAFPDGPRLCVYLIQRFYQPLITFLSTSAIDDSEGPLLDKLIMVAERWVQTSRRDLPFFLMINDAWRRPVPNPLPPMIQATIQAVGDRWFSMVTSLLAECQVRGEARPGNPEVMAHVVSATFYGMMVTLSRPDRLTANGIYTEDLIKITLETTLRGFQKRPEDG